MFRNRTSDAHLLQTTLPSDRSVSCGVVARDTEKPPLSRMDASSSDSSESVMAMARAVVFTSTWGDTRENLVVTVVYLDHLWLSPQPCSQRVIQKWQGARGERLPSETVALECGDTCNLAADIPTEITKGPTHQIIRCWLLLSRDKTWSVYRQKLLKNSFFIPYRWCETG